MSDDVNAAMAAKLRAEAGLADAKASLVWVAFWIFGPGFIAAAACALALALFRHS